MAIPAPSFPVVVPSFPIVCSERVNLNENTCVVNSNGNAASLIRMRPDWFEPLAFACNAHEPHQPIALFAAFFARIPVGQRLINLAADANDARGARRVRSRDSR